MYKTANKILNLLVLSITFIALMGVNVTQFKCSHSKHAHLEIAVLIVLNDCDNEIQEHKCNHNSCQHKQQENTCKKDKCTTTGCEKQKENSLYQITQLIKTEFDIDIIKPLISYLETNNSINEIALISKENKPIISSTSHYQKVSLEQLCIYII